MALQKWKSNSEAIAVAALALVAACFALIVSSQIYQSRPLTTDENSYLFQAGNFLEGRIARPLPPIQRAFSHSMIIMDDDAGWLSRYPPVHAIWLIPGVRIGYPYIMSLLGAALGILLMGLIAKRLNLSAPWTAILLVISPFYIFMYGSLLSHTSGFLLTASLLLFYIRWIQDQRASDAALAGLCWGLLFLNRSYTSLLMAIPFGIDATITFLSRRNRKAFIGCCCFAGVSLTLMGIYRFYNKLATGSSRLPTYLLYDASEGLGFGPRHTEGHTIHHTVERGIANVIENLTIMDQWIWGVAGGLALIFLLSLVGWRKRWTPILLACPIAIWAGHIAFWYAGLEHFRPVYFFETMVFLIIGASIGFDSFFRKLEAYPRYKIGLKISIAILLLIGGLPFTIQQSRFFYEHNADARRLYDAIQSAPPNALVLLGGLERKELGENMFNIRGLASDPLVARSNAFWNNTLVSLFPEKEVFTIDPDSLQLEPYDHEKQSLIRYYAYQTHRHTGTDVVGEDGQTLRVANPSFRPGFMLFGRYPYLNQGLWRVRIQYSLQDVEKQTPVIAEISADRGQTILASTKLYGSTTNAHTDIMVRLTGLQEIEPRIQYGGSGSIGLSVIEVKYMNGEVNP